VAAFWTTCIIEACYSRRAKAGRVDHGLSRAHEERVNAPAAEEDEAMVSGIAGQVNRIAFIGTYVPRECGIATFTKDLCDAMTSVSASCIAVPVNDRPEGYDYPVPVRFTIEENDLSSYRRSAEFLDINHVDVVSLQHEYGIYGGPAGSHILALLQVLRTPVVTTLHTVLAEPDEDQRKVLREITTLSDRVVVMSQHGMELLRTVYGVPPDNIEFIPHGIPDIPFVDPSFYKDQFGVAGRQVLLTFGMLGPQKGIEDVIRALPLVKKTFPDVVYLIVGATHPYWRREQGEAYRLSLQRLARDLEVEANVVFHNRFVEARELIEFIGATDIYVTPYLQREQITSGTLALAVGAGKAVISTPYLYAEEMLAEDRGVLVPFNDHEAIAEATIGLLSNEAGRHAMRKRAYMFARNMTWSNVAHQYLDVFGRSRVSRAERPRRSVSVAGPGRKRGELPGVQLQHLRRMTDQTGLLQHATHTIPNYHEGYTTDDNARALTLMVRLEELGEAPSDEVEDLATRYAAFLSYAFNVERGRFRNFFAYDHPRWLEDVGSEDSHGRALWALGVAVGRSNHAGLRDMAGQLFEVALGAARDLSSPRAWAFALLGIEEYLHWFSGDVAAQEMRRHLTTRLTRLYRNAATKDWPWFEDRLAYCNARLPHAMLVTGQALSNAELTNIGLTSLGWLADVQRDAAEHFVPIGTHGFYVCGKERARFDQQPIEACAMVAAGLEASRITGDTKWYAEAERAFEWFVGRNDLGVPVYDPRTGGCQDGLHPARVNSNQGGEATVSYLLSLVEMRLADQAIDLERRDAGVTDEQAEGNVEQPT
jgi:glycosyltransferase involved in cell wall biosynthesis